MKRVGITGGMGCGKSTVAREFRELGVPVFVSDIVAAGYYYDIDFLDSLRQVFGDSVFLEDGSADKKAIARLAFADRRLLDRLNKLVHPRVIDDFGYFCTLHSDAPYVMFESAILYDYGFDRMMDAVVCVYLDLDERLQRLAIRDNAPQEALMARISNQLPAEEMMMRADYVVLNYEGNPRRRQVTYIDKLLRQ